MSDTTRPSVETGNTESHAAAAKAHLKESGEHLRHAASLAGTSAKHAAQAARDELRVGGEAVREELDEARKAGRAAAHEAREVADEKLEAALGKGREFLASAEALIRERPLAAFGVAFAAGFLLSRIGRR